MTPKMENPALATRGVPETDLAGASINPEINTPHHLRLQVSRLVRLYAVNASLAEAIAPLVFLEGMRS
jgi:hypothetical protein